MKTQKPMVHIRGLRKSFGDHVVLHDIDFDVAPSQVVVVIGPSGSGKSTFLRCCNGLEQPDSGDVEICGHSLCEGGLMLGDQALNHLREQVGMVFQSFNLFAHLSVIDNITVGPRKVRGVPRAQAEAEALVLLEKVGLQQKAHAMPASLSGGQKQRVAIARALAMHPELVLFDEVTSALDPETVGEVLAVIRELVHDGLTCILVTHEMRFAEEVSHEIVFTEGGEIVEHGTPQTVFHSPRSPRTHSFINAMAHVH